MSHWSFATSFSLLLLALAVWLGAAWLCYANWERRGRNRTVGVLESLRLILMTLLVFTLLRPEFVRLIQRTEAPEIVVLHDASGSMETRDIRRATNHLSRAEWLAEQGEYWQPLQRKGRVLVEEFSAAAPESTNNADGTDINLALERALQRQKNLQAVLLVSDGDWTVGRSPIGAATRYRDQNIPVFAIGLGHDQPMPDLALERVSAPAYGLLGEQISIPFKVRSHLPREIKTTVTLNGEQTEEARKEITIPPMGEVQDAIVWAPRVVGEFNLTLQVPVEEDETVVENNVHELRIAVRSETLKVLVVDSLPRWEYRFLRNALERDPGVELHCLLFHPGMAPGGGRNYLPAFPGTRELISQYDVIFLGDVGIGDHELTESDAELIKGVVQQQSSGLVFLPGIRGRQLTLLRSPLQELLPVVLDESKPEGVGLQNESLLLLSHSGKGHLLTRFDADENRNDEIWQNLPGFYWSAAVEKSRPGSEVLAVHSSLRNNWGRIPLLVTRPYGSGKVLFMGTDSAWRWRRGVEDKYHYRFWSQVVRWMAHQRHLAGKQGIRLAFSPENPRVGETVFLQATVLDASGFPVESGPVIGKVSSPSERVERIDFTPLEGGWGVFKASFTPQQGGAHQIVVASPKHNRELETEIAIQQPLREKIGQPANFQVLREVASITQGASGTVEELPQILERIALLPEPKPVESRVRLWSSPWWGGLMLLLLGVYWTARKMAGMV